MLEKVDGNFNQLTDRQKTALTENTQIWQDWLQDEVDLGQMMPNLTVYMEARKEIQ